MGQHKHNEIAKLAKEGKLEPREPRKTHTELKREAQERIYNAFGRSRHIAEIFTVINSIKNIDKY